MSAERLEDAASRLKLPADVLGDHLWEQGVPAIDAQVELSPEMVALAEEFAARFAPTASAPVKAPPGESEGIASAADSAATLEAPQPDEEASVPEEGQLRSGVRRRRRRVEEPE